MDGTFVKELKETVLENQIVEDGDYKFSPRKMYPILTHEDEPNAINVTSLDSLIGYLKANIENLYFTKLMIIIKSPNEVNLVEAYKGPESKRVVYLSVSLDDELPKFPFDHYLDPEDFIIKARSMFLPSDDLESIIVMASKLTIQNEVTTEDNGLSQNLSLKKGISGAMSEKATTKGKYLLSPYRTFREVKQPESEFILRFRAMEENVPRIALFDAEGGMWRLQAMEEIQDYISTCIAALEVKIPVLA